MNSLKNSVHLIGRLGIDPEIKQTESGKTMARLSLGTSEVYKDSKGEKVENTQWHNLIAWEHKANFAANYLKKGIQIAVEGKLNNRTYEDKDGVRKYITEILVNEFLILSKKEDSVK